jgi:predicted dehydrogenase
MGRQKKLRTVLVGCGGMAGGWVRSQTVKKNVEIVGLVDIRKKATVSAAERWELPDAVTGTDMKKLLDKTDPELVFDCTVPEAHCGVTLTALRHGCHVLGEKPMANSMANARKMVAASKKAKKLYTVIQNRRYNNHIHAYRKAIASGKIGDLTTVNCDFYLGVHFGGFRDKMKHVLLLDMAIHTFDAIRYISGEDAVSAYCVEWNPKGSWYRHGASAQVTFEMTSGVIASYRGSWCAEGCDTSWESNWRAIGTKGTALWDGGQNVSAEVVTAKKGFARGKRPLEIGPRGNLPRIGHNGVIHDFIKAVRTGKEPQTICTDNIKSLAMVFAAVDSAEKGKKVKITT